VGLIFDELTRVAFPAMRQTDISFDRIQASHQHQLAGAQTIAGILAPRIIIRGRGETPHERAESDSSDHSSPGICRRKSRPRTKPERQRRGEQLLLLSSPDILDWRSRPPLGGLPDLVRLDLR
jgi:hypothetical protein